MCVNSMSHFFVEVDLTQYASDPFLEGRRIQQKRHGESLIGPASGFSREREPGAALMMMGLACLKSIKQVSRLETQAGIDGTVLRHMFFFSGKSQFSS